MTFVERVMALLLQHVKVIGEFTLERGRRRKLSDLR